MYYLSSAYNIFGVDLKMIHKSKLKGKHITYIDKDEKQRTAKVIKVVGSTVTVIKANRVKQRVHRNQVLGRQYRKRGLDPIEWGRKK